MRFPAALSPSPDQASLGSRTQPEHSEGLGHKEAPLFAPDHEHILCSEKTARRTRNLLPWRQDARTYVVKTGGKLLFLCLCLSPSTPSFWRVYANHTPPSLCQKCIVVSPWPVDIAHLEKAAERGPSGSTGLRLLSNMASPPGASRTIAATRVPALAPTKTKLDMAVGVPLGVNLNDSNDANDAESCSTRGGRDRDSCDGDVGVGVDGDEQQSQGEDEDEDYDGEDVLLSSFDSDSAPVHLLFEEGDANKECRK